MEFGLIQGLLLAQVVTYVSLTLISWVKVKYEDAIQEYPLVVAVQPFWGMATGGTAQALLLALVGRGWERSPHPSLSVTLAAVVEMSVIAFLAAPAITLIGYPMFIVGRGHSLPPIPPRQRGLVRRRYNWRQLAYYRFLLRELPRRSRYGVRYLLVFFRESIRLVWRTRRQELPLALIPLLIANPLWTAFSVLLFRGLIQLGFYPAQVMNALASALFTVLIDVLSFEAVRRGYLRRPGS